MQRRVCGIDVLSQGIDRKHRRLGQRHESQLVVDELFEDVLVYFKAPHEQRFQFVMVGPPPSERAADGAGRDLVVVVEFKHGVRGDIRQNLRTDHSK